MTLTRHPTFASGGFANAVSFCCPTIDGVGPDDNFEIFTKQVFEMSFAENHEMIEAPQVRYPFTSKRPTREGLEIGQVIDR